MDFVKASKRSMVASSLLSPHAAIFKAFSAMQYTSSSRLSPTAAEFILPSAYVITTSDLSPQSVPSVPMSSMQTEFNMSPQSTCFVSMSPFEMTLASGLSPQATIFAPMSTYEMTPESGLSPQATNFVPVSPSEMTYESGLSPHAAIFVPTSAEQTILPNNYRPGMGRVESAIESCEAELISQYNDLKQHQDECTRHYIAFLKWKYFERYDEPCQDEDIASVQYLADARDFRCTKCRDHSLKLERQFQYTSDKYMRLVSMHCRAAIDFAST